MNGNKSGGIMKRVVFALLLMLLPTVCYADVNDVMRALRHLERITTYGTSYKDYALYLGEAKSEVGYYLKADKTKEHKKLRDAISETMDLYEFADSLFSRIDTSNGSINMGADASPIDKKLAAEYFSRFPEDKKDVAEGGVLKNGQGDKLQLRTALNKIFKRASVKYAEVAKLLQ
jgi:hypothetical protein